MSNEAPFQVGDVVQFTVDHLEETGLQNGDRFVVIEAINGETPAGGWQALVHAGGTNGFTRRIHEKWLVVVLKASPAVHTPKFKLGDAVCAQLASSDEMYNYLIAGVHDKTDGLMQRYAVTGWSHTTSKFEDQLTLLVVPDAK